MNKESDNLNLCNENKSIILFTILTLLATFSLFNADNYLSPVNEIIILFLSLAIGVFTIKYYFKTRCIHKTVFLIILLFGLLFVFLSPLNSISDEGEHFMRSEITSEGVLFPEYVKNSSVRGFLSIGSMMMPRDVSIFESDWSYQPINQTPFYVNSAFQQNPFYAYIAQAIGIDLAKTLNLTNMFMVFFARICNLLLYASLSMLAIRKTPVLKVPMAVVACFPLAIVQAASMSADGFIFSFSFVVIAYLLYMYKSKEATLSKKNIAVYTALVLILALSKVTLASLILLIFIVPRKNFKNRNDYYLAVISVIFILACVFLWTRFYAVDAITHSYRYGVFKRNHVNSTQQLEYVLSNPQAAVTFLQIANQMPAQIEALSQIYTTYHNYPLFNYLYFIFFSLFAILYPIGEKISRKTRTITALTVVILIFGTYVVQFLTWAPVGSLDLIKAGVVPRYFLAAFTLFPLIFNINRKNVKINESLIITLIVTFISAILMFTATMIY